MFVKKICNDTFSRPFKCSKCDNVIIDSNAKDTISTMTVRAFFGRSLCSRIPSMRTMKIVGNNEQEVDDSAVKTFTAFSIRLRADTRNRIRLCLVEFLSFAGSVAYVRENEGKNINLTGIVSLFMRRRSRFGVNHGQISQYYHKYLLLKLLDVSL